MTFMSSNDIREAFLSFFEKHNHQRVDSSSLIPANDNTLLFTNAGMVQFKECFLGTEQRDYTRATSSQRCVRAGGKHNDLENVGYTARHHTFFEMLGNFSFGDYFKEDAINFAWQFLTQELGLPEEKLWVTVYHEDKEAEQIWFEKIGINQERFSRLGEKDNFWSMGDTGPCGPCTEIFYDHGPDVAGGPPGSPDEDGDRYIEIWNLVFMQYNRDKQGNMTPLPKPSVDTGMGLERIAAVMQNVHSNYEIDLFAGLIKSIASLLKVSDLSAKSLRVIADHIRSCAFLIADGVVPSNEGRGYVLRRIMRRAIRHGHKLGAQQTFFNQLVKPLADQMGQAYPELVEKGTYIADVILREENQFARTLDNGMKILEQDLQSLKGSVISGDTVFTLYDTYGFPMDLTADIARERELTIDEVGFNRLMDEQKARSKDAGKFDHDYNENLSVDGQTEFLGYQHLEQSSPVTQLFIQGEQVQQAAIGETALVIAEQTPFYAESGGQVGDQGWLEWDGGRAMVLDTNKINKAFAHRVEITEGALSVNQQVTFKVDATLRQKTAIHHSATHLLHAALRKILGDHVTQKGSLVDPNKLRFDFSHPEPVTHEQLVQIEQLVNQQVRANDSVDVALMSMDDAIDQGAMALFGEKYDDEVRVLTMGEFSMELCGGTHVNRLGDIGQFKIVQESGIAAGIRRIEAVAGEVAVNWVLNQESLLDSIAKLVKASSDAVPEKLEQLLRNNRQLEKDIEKLKHKLASNQSGDLLSNAVDINGVTFLATQVEGVDGKGLRDLLDQLKSKLDKGVILLGAANGDKANLIAGVTKSVVGQIKAGDLVKHAASIVGGKGGGRPDMAQAGGSQPEKLPEAIAAADAFVREALS